MTPDLRGTISLGDMYFGSMTLVEPTVKYLKLIHETKFSRSLSPIMNTSSSAHHVPSQLYTSTIASFQQGNIISSMILNTTCFYFPLHLTMKNSLYPDNNSSPLTIFILFTGWKREYYKPLWYVSCVFQYGVLHPRVYVLYVNHSLPFTCIQFLEVNPYSVVEHYQKIKTHQVC